MLIHGNYDTPSVYMLETTFHPFIIYYNGKKIFMGVWCGSIDALFSYFRYCLGREAFYLVFSLLQIPREKDFILVKFSSAQIASLILSLSF